MWLRTTEIYSHDLEAGSQRVVRAFLPPKAFGEGLSWSRPASGGFRHSLACGRITQNSASCPHGLPLCPCVSPLCLQRYLSLDLGTTWIAQNDLILRSLTISANTLFPNKVTFTGFGDQDVNIAFLRLPFNPADDHKPLAESAES